MKKRIFIAVLSLCVVCIALFSAGCSNSGALEKQIADLQQQVEQLTEENEELSSDKGGLESQLAALQKEFETLKSENSLTEEQLADLQFKFEKLMKVDWLHQPEPGYEYDSVRVFIKQGVLTETPVPEDFLTINVDSVEFDYETEDYLAYILYLKESGIKQVVNAVIKAFYLDFVWWADLLYGYGGA